MYSTRSTAVSHDDLWNVAYLGNCFDLERLLHHGDVDVDSTRVHGVTPLLAAAVNGNYHIMRRLIDHGANTRVRDLCGGTILHTIAGIFHTKHDEQLVMMRGLLNEWSTGILIDVNCMNNNGQTPLHRSAMIGSVESLRNVLQLKPDVSIQESTGRTSLHMAAARGHNDIVRTLISHMTVSQIDQRDMYGSTALHFAICGTCPPEWDVYQCVHRRIELVGLLLDAGADPLVEDHDGVPAYQMADNRNQRAICEILTKATDLRIRRTMALLCLHKHLNTDPLRRIFEQL